MKKIAFFTVLFLLSKSIFAQVVQVSPAFPNANDQITIYFDAAKGNEGLKDCNCEIYVHTGLITSSSSGDSDWKHVVTNWSEANPQWKMTKVLGEDNRYSYVISPTIAEYYGVSEGEEIEKIAFVFRNAEGSKEGKDVGGKDIFVDVYPEDIGFSLSLNSPANSDFLVELNDKIDINAATTEPASITVYQDGDSIYNVNNDILEYELIADKTGIHFVEISANNGTDTVKTSFYYIVPDDNIIEDLPGGIEDGITILDDSTVYFTLYAPNKSNVFVLGDFNDWKIGTDFQLKNTTDGKRWWIKVTGLSPQIEYGMQYLVDGKIRIGDPYSEMVLDPWNDKYISDEIFPNLKPYPEGKAEGIVSVFSTTVNEFAWSDGNFVKPDKGKLVIYELLLRDFLEDHSFKSLKDTLNYLQKLGVNAIELLPVNEFEGNISWGYNPSYHNAVDKYYGTPEALKAFIDEAHNRGIAVILDVVYNHGFGQCPLVRLYWDDKSSIPAADSPWFNPKEKHPFNVGYDFNHESEATKYYVKKGLSYWLKEFHFDGFRFDLSKGFTQKYSTNNDQMASYDATRIAILSDYANYVWSIDDSAYVILEHFAANNEETELSKRGMMLWGNMNHQYNEASMGYNSDLSYVIHKKRGWGEPNLVGFMESHDEERLNYKNLQYGNSKDDYNIKSLPTALDRLELTGVFFFTLPGPKMIWQFGELGFDYSINTCEDGTISENCRLSPKPIRWDYLQNKDRAELYDLWSHLIFLKKEYDIFDTDDFTYSLSGYAKTIHLNSNDNNVAIIGNFGVKANSIDPQFQHTGWWYEYFSGDSVNIQDVSEQIELKAGEFRLYCDTKLEGNGFRPVDNPVPNVDFNVFPNPSSGKITATIKVDKAQEVDFNVYDFVGKKVFTQKYFLKKGQNVITLYSSSLPQSLQPSVYIFNFSNENINYKKKMIVDN